MPAIAKGCIDLLSRFQEPASQLLRHSAAIDRPVRGDGAGTAAGREAIAARYASPGALKSRHMLRRTIARNLLRKP
jgi:hypothetical protein